MAVTRYHERVSGPLRDRLDLTVELSPVTFDTLTSDAPAEASADVRRRVESARRIQRMRAAATGAAVNSRLTPAALRRVVPLDRQCTRHLAAATNRLALSGRAVHRSLRVARTIADLDNSPDVTSAHLLEALQFRTGAHGA